MVAGLATVVAGPTATRLAIPSLAVASVISVNIPRLVAARPALVSAIGRPAKITRRPRPTFSVCPGLEANACPATETTTQEIGICKTATALSARRLSGAAAFVGLIEILAFGPSGLVEATLRASKAAVVPTRTAGPASLGPTSSLETRLLLLAFYIGACISALVALSLRPKILVFRRRLGASSSATTFAVGAAMPTPIRQAA